MNTSKTIMGIIIRTTTTMETQSSSKLSTTNKHRVMLSMAKLKNNRKFNLEDMKKLPTIWRFMQSKSINVMIAIQRE